MTQLGDCSIDEPTARLTFAVVIPAYNAAQTIRRCVDSVLCQTRQADEVVVCNDGSTDRTADILAEYGERIRVIHQPNGGLSAARNASLHTAQSDFVVLLDADDAWLPERLQRIEEHLVANPHLDIVTSDAWVVKDGLRTTRWYANRTFPAEECQPIEVLRGNFIFGAAAVRRESLLALGGWDQTVSHQGEYEGWIRMILSGSRAGLVAVPLAFYHIAPGSLSANRRRTHVSILAVLAKTAKTNTLTGLVSTEVVYEIPVT